VRAALLLLLLLGQEKATIAFKPVQGEKLTATDSIVLKLKGKSSFNGVEEEIWLELSRRRRSVTEFAEVADGALRRKIIKTDEDVQKLCTDEKDPGEETQQPLHGCTATVSLKDGKTVIDGIEKPDLDTTRTLRLLEPESDLWPAAAVAVGGSWESTKADFLSRLLDLRDAESKVTLTLKELKEIGGRTCCVITVKADVSGKIANGTEYTLALSGELVAAADRGIVLTMKLEGKAVLNREHETYKMRAEGSVVLERKGELK